eukprot:scaffold258862_cov98-Attheya_sp.AAC.1
MGPIDKRGCSIDLPCYPNSHMSGSIALICAAPNPSLMHCAHKASFRKTLVGRRRWKPWLPCCRHMSRQHGVPMRFASNSNKPFASWWTMSGSNVDCLPVMGSTTLSHSTQSDRDHDNSDHRQHIIIAITDSIQ